MDNRPALEIGDFAHLKSANGFERGGVLGVDLVQFSEPRSGVVVRVVEPVSCGTRGGGEFSLVGSGAGRNWPRIAPDKLGNLIGLTFQAGLSYFELREPRRVGVECRLAGCVAVSLQDVS